MEFTPGTEQFFNSLCQEVWGERLRQVSKWGTEANQYLVLGRVYNLHKTTVLGEEYGEVCRSVLEGDLTGLREELIQVAAVVMAWLEMCDTN